MNRYFKFRRTLLLAGLIMANLTFASQAAVDAAPPTPMTEGATSQVVVAGSSRNTDTSGPQAFYRRSPDNNGRTGTDRGWRTKPTR